MKKLNKLFLLISINCFLLPIRSNNNYELEFRLDFFLKNDSINFSATQIDSLLKLSKRCASEFNYSKSIIALKSIVNQDSTFTQAWIELENLLSKNRQYQEALNAITHIFQQTDTSQYYMIRKGLLLKEMGVYQASHHIFSEALDNDTTNTFIINQIADLYQLQNKSDSAVMCYTRGCEIRPTRSSVIKAVRILLALNKNKEALDFFVKYQDEEQLKNKLLNGLYGKTLYLNDHLDQATEVLEKSYQCGDTSKLTTKFLGMCYWKKKQYPEGKEVLLQCISKDSMDYQTYYFLGVCCIHNFELNEGEKYLNKALNLLKPDGKTLNLIYNEMAGIYEEQLKYDKALEIYKAMVHNDPQNRYVEYKIASVYDYFLKNRRVALKKYITLLTKIKEKDVSLKDTTSSKLEEFLQKRIEELKRNDFWEK